MLAGLAISGMFMIVVIAIVSTSWTRHRKAELQAQVQTKLIDRFESAPQLIEFLKSPTGQEFVSGVKARQAGSVNRKVLSGIRGAVFMVVLGIGFLTLWGLAHEEGFMYPGVLLLALGLGMFFSTVISIKLSRDWGLSDEPHPTPVQPGSGDVR